MTKTWSDRFVGLEVFVTGLLSLTVNERRSDGGERSKDWVK